MTAQPLYGMCNNCIKIGDTVYEAVENENDGYRSMLDELKIITDPEKIKSLTFSDLPISYVELVENVENRGSEYSYDDFRGYEVRDVYIDHVWARLGTRNYDDYYPCFVADWHPIAPDAMLKWQGEGVDNQMSAEEFQRFIREADHTEPARQVAARWRVAKKRAEVKAKVAHYEENSLFGSF